MRNLLIKTLALVGMLFATITVTAADSGVSIESAFPNLRIARPIVITHAGDGSNRIFVASQLGSIHVFDNHSEVEEASLFFDHEEQVTYKDKENEDKENINACKPAIFHLRLGYVRVRTFL